MPKKMKEEEIDAIFQETSWATLCMVDPDGNPYGIEFGFFLDHGDICGLVHPRGRAAACLSAKPHVCVKFCRSDHQCMGYQAVSCFGVASYESLTDPLKVAWAWDQLARQLGLVNDEFTHHKQRYLNSGKALPLLRILVHERTGVKSSTSYLYRNKMITEPASAAD